MSPWRATQDIDLRLLGAPQAAAANLRDAVRIDLGDILPFEVEPDQHHPDIQGEGMIYDGLRFRVQRFVAGKILRGRRGSDSARVQSLVIDPWSQSVRGDLPHPGTRPTLHPEAG